MSAEHRKEMDVTAVMHVGDADLNAAKGQGKPTIMICKKDDPKMNIASGKCEQAMERG